MQPKRKGRRGILNEKGSGREPRAKAPVPPGSRETPALVLDLMVEALRVNDERLNAIAIEVNSRLGTQHVRRLVLEAADTKRAPGHRVRLLQVIRKIGGVDDVASHLDLFTLLRDRNPEVRAAAVEAIVAIRDRADEGPGGSGNDERQARTSS